MGRLGEEMTIVDRDLQVVVTIRRGVWIVSTRVEKAKAI
jgi:hypothetical protein